jgi:hypothetical protein
MILKLYSRWPWEKNTDYQKPEPQPEPEEKTKSQQHPVFSFLEMYMSNPFILFLIFILLNLATAPRTIYQDENQDLEEHFHYLEGITRFRKAHYHHYKGPTKPIRDEENHTHEYEISTSTELGHSHTLVGSTGPAVPLSEGGHIHKYAETPLGQNGHAHEYSGFTASISKS